MKYAFFTVSIANLIALLSFNCAVNAAGNDDISNHISTCCNRGLRHARAHTNCNNYDYEVGTIPPIWRGLCHSAYGVCCSREIVQQHCVAGRKAALASSRCDLYNTTSYVDCCLSCQVGLGVRANNNDCNDPLFSYFTEIESFRICCDGSDDDVGTGQKSRERHNLSTEHNEDGADGIIVLPEDDVDICGKVPNLCAHICENTEEAYRCKCHPGYRLEENNVTCVPIVSQELLNETKANQTDNNHVFTGNSIDDYDDGETEDEKEVDIDECTLNLANCRSDQYCHNTKGSYRCLNITSRNCERGFRYDTKSEQCEDVNECIEQIHDCKDAQQCLNFRGGYRCVHRGHPHLTSPPQESQPMCKLGLSYNSKTQNCEVDASGGDGLSSSPVAPSVSKKVRCGEGFELKNGRCVDIDECTTDNQACDSSQVCSNDIGGYHCDCKIGFNLDTTTNACVDINECSINNHNCLQTQRCDNTVGSFICTRLQSCGTGYTLNAETGQCDDDDECTLKTHNCTPDYECFNTKGSFRCYRRPPSTTSTTSTSTSTSTTTTTTNPPLTTTQSSSRSGAFAHGSNRPNLVPYRPYAPYHYLPNSNQVQCNVGFQRNHLGACVDVNECILPNTCGTHQRCLNTNGSYRCKNLLECSGGYKSTPDGSKCVDIDECETGEHNCAENQVCRNRNGGFTCECPPGHQLTHLSNNINRCVDINECEQSHPFVCPKTAQCINTIGSYYCDCKSGFQKSRNDGRTCLDVDECQEIPGLCHQVCVNFWGGYRCSCNPGYELAADNRTCNDVDECEVHKTYNLCMGFCDNVPGSYECSCPRGYTLATDRNTCRDIDECASGDVCTGRNDICTNIRGSYRCTTIRCPYGYKNDVEHKNRCIQENNFCDGDDCYNKPSSYTYNFITLVSKLLIPPEGRILFTLRGLTWYNDIDYDLKIVRIQAVANIEKATDHHFEAIKRGHEVHLNLKRTLEGPQDVELELTMTVFTNGQPRGKSVAQIFILVSQYTF